MRSYYIIRPNFMIFGATETFFSFISKPLSITAPSEPYLMFEDFMKEQRWQKLQILNLTLSKIVIGSGWRVSTDRLPFWTELAYKHVYWSFVFILPCCLRKGTPQQIVRWKYFRSHFGSSFLMQKIISFCHI